MRTSPSYTRRSTAILAVGLVAATAVSAVPVLESRYTGPNGKTQDTSAGGTGPNPKNYPGDGGNGLTITVVDPMSNNSITNPSYRAISDFDYASFNLGLYQEWIELDLFNYGLKRFSAAEFDEAGMGPSERGLLQFMANQETGHAQLLTNILGEGAAKQCTYNYSGAFSNVREYLNFNQQLTRWGESGVWGFLSQLNSRPSASLLAQSIATEARQQMAFRQFAGAPAMDVYFEAGIPQSWAWTLLAPYIQSCPTENPRIGWSNYASLKVENNPTLARAGSKAAVSTNITALIQPNETFSFKWGKAGEKVGPDQSYTTVSPAKNAPKYVLWLSQYNASFTPLTITSEGCGYAKIPAGPVFNTPIANTGPSLNGTAFVAIVDDNPFLTNYNFSLILPHMVAGPAIFQAG